MSPQERIGSFREFLEVFRKAHPDLCMSLREMHISGRTREELLRVLGFGRYLGLDVTTLCKLLQISRRRYYYWHDCMLSIDDGERVHRPFNALKCEQQKQLVQLIKKCQASGLQSVRKVASRASRELGLRVSHVTVWRYLKELDNGKPK